MDDVYINDPRQNSAQKIAKRNRMNAKRPRGFKRFLFDLIVKTLICSAFIAIDFALFAQAGSYSMFNLQQMPTQEVLYIGAGIVAVCFAIMFLFSFSIMMQNLLIATTIAGFVLAMFNQFALFDENSILYGMFGRYIDASMANVFITHSDWVLAGMAALIGWIVVSYSSRKNQFWLLATLMVLLGFVVSRAYFTASTKTFHERKALAKIMSKDTDGENFIFIALPDFGSYLDIKGATSKNFSVKQVSQNLLGFYTLNGFTHFPHAYVEKYTDVYMNLVASLNLDKDKKVENNLLDNAILGGFWNFDKLDTDKLYLQNNELFKSLVARKYNIKAFQNRGIELCSVNNTLAVSKCMEKSNTPISLNIEGMSDIDKTILLTSQWLESTGFIPNINLPLMAASYLTNTVSPLNFSSNDLYAVNSFKVFDLILDDLKSATGNNAYFAVIDMPASTYVYDDFCAIKKPSRWVSGKTIPWSKNNNLNAQQQAYAEQTNCLIGQLENFIQELSRAGKLEKTTLILQGINPSAVFANHTKELKDFSRVGMAVLRPNAKTAKTGYFVCKVSSLVNTIVSNEKCQELNDLELVKDRKEKIIEEAHRKYISDQDMENSVVHFKEWYQAFAGNNQYKNDLDTPTTTTQKDKKIEVVKTTEVVEELPAEEKMKSISVAISETSEEEALQAKDDKEAKTAPKAKPTAEQKVKEVKAQVQPKIEPKAETKVDVGYLPKLTLEPKVESKPEPKKTIKTKTPKVKTPKVVEVKVETEVEEIPLTKPEILKREYRKKLQQQKAAGKIPEVKPEVHISVDVIDNTERLDVLPPALLGETKYKAAE